MEEREKNLRRWAELAPGECALWNIPEAIYPEFNITVGHGAIITALAEDRDALLGALIEAVRARGWHYNLFSDEERADSWHQASVYTVSNVIPQCFRQAAEPCDALLDAYVSSLRQATEGKEKAL